MWRYLYLGLLTLYFTAALSILIGAAWYSGAYRWAWRILVFFSLLLHVALSSTELGFSAWSLLRSVLIIVGSMVFTVWMYWLARHRSMHLIQVLNLCVVLIMIENYMTRDLYGIGLFGRVWIH